MKIRIRIEGSKKIDESIEWNGGWGRGRQVKMLGNSKGGKEVSVIWW